MAGDPIANSFGAIQSNPSVAPGGGYSNGQNAISQILASQQGSPGGQYGLMGMDPASLQSLMDILGVNAPGYAAGANQQVLQGLGQTQQYNLGLAQLQNLLSLAGINQQTAEQTQAMQSAPGLMMASEMPQLFSSLTGAIGGLGGALGGGSFPMGMQSNSGAGFSFGGANPQASSVASSPMGGSAGAMSAPYGLANQVGSYINPGLMSLINAGAVYSPLFDRNKFGFSKGTLQPGQSIGAASSNSTPMSAFTHLLGSA